MRITDRNFILIDGHIVARGNAVEISNDELVRKHYLGQGFEPLTTAPTMEPDEEGLVVEEEIIEVEGVPESQHHPEDPEDEEPR